MPFLRLTVTPQLSAEVSDLVALELTDLMAVILLKNASLTSVLIESPGGRWTIGRQSQDIACHLDVTITEGTNSPEQKSKFIGEAMSVLRKHISPLHSATYISIHEVPAANWGYDGRTQQSRR